MRTYLTFVLLFAPVIAFVPAVVHKKTFSTKLDVHRRDLLITGIVGLLVAPELVTAKSSTFFYDDKIEEKPPEPSQLPTGGKMDLNSAFVVRYISELAIYSISNLMPILTFVPSYFL